MLRLVAPAQAILPDGERSYRNVVVGQLEVPRIMKGDFVIIRAEGSAEASFKKVRGVERHYGDPLLPNEPLTLLRLEPGNPGRPSEPG